MRVDDRPEEGAWYVSKKPIEGFDQLPFNVVRVDDIDGIIDIEFKNGYPSTIELSKWSTLDTEEDLGDLDFFLGTELLNIDDEGNFIDDYSDTLEVEFEYGIHERDFIEGSSDYETLP